MKNLIRLDSDTLNAVTIALDGYQRFATHDSAEYFFRILDRLIGPLPKHDFNEWGLRKLLGDEANRRLSRTVIKVADAKASELIAKLPPQQLRILKLSAEGYTIEAIADMLDISYRTVVNTRTRLMHVLGLGSTKDIARFGQKHFDYL